LPPIDVVLVNWNSGTYLHECLQSFVDGPWRHTSIGKVIVVDNASSDHSLDGIGLLPPPVLILRNTSNRGFAAACNQGAKAGTAPLILFLNPDTRLNPDSISVPVRFLSRPEQDQVGICGVQLLDRTGCVSRTCMRFPTAGRLLSSLAGSQRCAFTQHLGYSMLDWAHDDTRRVDAVSGAFMVVRRPLFEALGGFEERFFLYFEEIDFCYRAFERGWSSAYVSEARVYHEGSPSWDRLDAWKLFHSARSRIMYSFLHCSAWSAALYALSVMVIEPCSRVLAGMVHGSFRSVMEGIRAYVLLGKHLPAILKEAARR
jgi:GT2 family glycosyltransferase